MGECLLWPTGFESVMMYSFCSNLKSNSSSPSSSYFFFLIKKNNYIMYNKLEVEHAHQLVGLDTHVIQ